MKMKAISYVCIYAHTHRESIYNVYGYRYIVQIYKWMLTDEGHIIFQWLL